MNLHMVNLLLEHGQHGGMLRGVSTGLCGDSWRYTLVFFCDWCVSIVITIASPVAITMHRLFMNCWKATAQTSCFG